jgi:hypothetical protein
LRLIGSETAGVTLGARHAGQLEIVPQRSEPERLLLLAVEIELVLALALIFLGERPKGADADQAT